MATCTIVIPCYNEGNSMPALINRCAEAAQAAPGLSFCLVNNGSSDETGQYLRDLPTGVTALHLEQNQGYGGGILAGLRACTSDHLGWTHADLQTDPFDAIPAWNAAKTHSGAVLVKGSRKGRSFADRFFTTGMTLVEAVLLQAWMPDINAQPTLLTQAMVQAWTEPPKDFSLDVFAFATARHQGIPVWRFPVAFPPRPHGQSHWNTNLRGRWRFIRRTLVFSWTLRQRTRR